MYKYVGKVNEPKGHSALKFLSSTLLVNISKYGLHNLIWAVLVGKLQSMKFGYFYFLNISEI